MHVVSDDERREVAERLRGLASDADEVSDFDLAKTLDLCAVSRYGYDPRDVERLADLIDPSCDREALLALASGLEADADRILRAARNARFGGGPRMGEAKHDADEWRSIARCIREACGEVVW